MPYDRLLRQLRTGDSGGAGTVTSVAAANGLSSSPSPITTTGTVSLDINTLTSESTLASGDLFAFVDVSVGTGPTAQRKVTLADLATAIGTGGTVTSIAAGIGIALTPDPITTTGTVAVDAKLAALDALGGTGILVQTGATSFAVRSLTQPAAGITISNNDGVSGNPTFALADDLAAVEGLSTTGIAVRTGTSAWTTRTITAGTQSTALGSITDGDGVSGNPTINFPDPGLFTIQGYNTIDVSDYDPSAAPDYNLIGALNGSSLATAGLTANILYAAPFVCTRDCTIEELYIRLAGSGAAGREARIGIYTNKGRTRLYPDALVYSSGALSLAAAPATVGETGLSITLTAGTLYWYAFVENNTNPTFTKLPGAAAMPIGVDKDNITTVWLAVSRVFSYGALPDPFGTTGTPVAVVTLPPVFFAKMSA